MSESNTLHSFLTSAGFQDKLPVWAKGVVMPLTPLPHQVETLRKGLEAERFGDYSEPGCMKTLTAQALAITSVIGGVKAIYMTKPTLVTQVKDSFAYNYPGLPLSVEAFSGDVDERMALFKKFTAEGFPDILILSDKAFIGPESSFKKKKKEKPKLFAFQEEAKPAKPKGRMVLETNNITPVNYSTFKRAGYRMLISDDVVGIKTTSSQVHQSVEDFIKDTDKLWIMNGTPVENTPSDAYGFMHLISPRIYRSRKFFERTHAVWGEPGEFGRKIVGWRNLEMLKDNLYFRGVRFTKKDVLGLPPVTYVDVPVVLSKQHKALYDKVVNEMLLEFEDGTMLDFTSTQRMYQVSQQMLVNAEHVTKTKVPDNRMLATLDDLVESLEGKKTLIGAWYTETVKTVAERLHKLNPAVIYGGNTDKEREAEKRKFIDDPTCKVAVTNYLSGGVGIDGFQKVCSHAVALEMVTVPGFMEQWVSRINRGGQNNPMTVYLMVAKGTIAVRLRRSLLDKDAVANAVIGDKRMLMKELLGETT